MSDRIGCARLSRDAGEDLAGTASTVRRWLLVEQDGPWGADAVLESRLQPGVAQQLASLGKDLRTRVLLIRRYGRAADPGRRTAFAAVTTTRRRWLERIEFEDHSELLARDWGPLREGRSVGGRRESGPLFLVCTNGSHDACCAELGRPLAAALSAVEPAETWECSHFGGDRFAANVVCLPDGVYYGRVSPADARALAAATRARKLSLAHFRGRSTLSFAEQAAEITVRRRAGLDDIDALEVTGREQQSEGVRLTFRDAAGGEHEVVVAVRRDVESRMLSCAEDEIPPLRFDTQVVASTAPPESRASSERAGS